MAAGDIACPPASAAGCPSEGTAALAASRGPDVVAMLGDAQYEDGTLAEFQGSYDLTWGTLKAVTKPAVGNHEYHTGGAAGYYTYFGAAAGDPSKGWYSYEAGAWHVVVLNSNCAAVGGCGAGSAQEQWLRADLGAHPTACTLAYWHHPRFSSGPHGSNATYDAFWRALQDGGADVVLNGHDHVYERFHRQLPDGTQSTAGIKEFVVGTGGRGLSGFSSTAPNSAFRSSSANGVLELVLHADSYDWRFLPVGGAALDSGTTACH